MAGAAVVGGLVEGVQPETLTWERMKYGQHVQDDTDRWIDAGRPSDVDPHRGQIDNRNQDGDPRIYITPGAWAVWDAVRVRNTHDGIGLYGDPDEGFGTCYIRNCWLHGIHDDAIENDDWQALLVSDTLVEGTYTFLSCQNHALDGVRHDAIGHGGGQRHAAPTVPRRLQDPLDGRGARPDLQESGQRAGAGAAQRRHRVGAVPRPAGDGPRLPERRGRILRDHYENVTLVWLGTGPYPGNVPDGCRLTTDPAVYEDAAADWKTRHGVVDEENVDMDRLIDPAPVGR